MRYHDPLPQQVYLSSPRKRRHSALMLLLAGIGLSALMASPAGRAVNSAADLTTASIPQKPAVAEAPIYRTTLAASRLTMADIVFGAPLSNDPANAIAMREPVRSAALETHIIVEPAPEPAAVQVAATEPAQVPEVAPPEAEAVPLPPVNPFRQNGQRTVVARAPVAQPVSAPASDVRQTSEPNFFQRIFSAPAEPPSKESSTLLAYAPLNDDRDNPLRNMSPFRRPVPVEKTAFYVINQGKVYMPDGSQLEAHSGIADKRDNPRYTHVRMKGATPPNTYTLKMRERLFHGVEAIRMLPTEPGRMFGRDGILAHSYLLGPNGDSHGCVAFRDYAKFLNAFKRGEVTRIVVVADASTMLAMNTAQAR